MTSTIHPPAAPLQRRRVLVGGGDRMSAAARAELDELGWIAVLALRTFMFLAPTAMFLGVWGYEPLRVVQQTFYALPAFGALIIVPRRAVLRVPISLSFFLLLGWMAMSVLWSVDSGQTIYSVRQLLALSLAAVIAVGLLPVEETFRWLLAGTKFLLVVAAIAIVIDPSTRSTLEFGQRQEAWQAWFPSKNNFGRFLAFATATFALLERRPISRVAWIGFAVFMALGARSATTVAALFLLAAVVWWVTRYKRLGDEWSGLFAFASVILGLIGVAAAYASTALIVEALGRDLTFTGRTDIWSAVVPAIQERPWLGYGYEALFTTRSAESRELIREIGHGAAHSHNGALDTMAAIGIPGLVLFFGLLVSTLVAALRHLRDSTHAAWVFTFIVLMLVFGLVESTYIGDWLGMLVIGRLSLAKLSRSRRVLTEEDTLLSEAIRPTLSIDLDAEPLIPASARPD